jgi:hypothetical protein
MTTHLKPDQAKILEALGYLFKPDDVIELRALSKDKKRTDSGYFDSENWSSLAAAAASLNVQGMAVYVTLNPVDPHLLSRYHNRVERFAKDTTNDKQVLRRRWLPIDIDPQRPANTSATADQLKLAIVKAEAIRGYLSKRGWPKPAAALSGNGMHLLYAIDLPNDDESKRLVEHVLKSLAAMFDDETVKVDRSVFNAARIWKLYGTVANKGDNTQAAPWRLAHMLDKWMPARVDLAPELMQALAPMPTHATQTARRGLDFGRSGAGQQFMLEDFFRRHGIEYSQDTHDGSERFKLAHCPFNSEHKGSEVAVFRKPSGALGFKCMHNSCSGKSWQDVRDLLDGPRAERMAATGPSTAAPTRIDPATGEVLHEGEWPEPNPLASELPPVQAFDADLLPDSLRDWIMDIADRMQCPPDFPAVGAIAALSSLIGARAVIAPKRFDSWTVVPNEWGLIVGNPGVMKSPALSEVLSPLHHKETELREVWQAERSQWLIDQKTNELRAHANEVEARKVLKGNRAANVASLLGEDHQPAEPVMRRLIVNDTSVEALGEVMEASPWGILAYRDEVYGLLKSMDKEGQEGARAFYLQGFDGDKPYTFDRIGRGLNRRIERVCISMLGGIQPGRISEYIRAAVAGGSGDDGLIQRFQLAVWPDVQPTWRNVDRAPNAEAKQRAHAVYGRLADIPEPRDNVPVWRFEESAQLIFDDWRAKLEPRIRGDQLHPAMTAHLSKFRKLVPALSLIFAMIDDHDVGTVREADLLRALAWAEYLETHATRLYAAAITPEIAGAKALLRRIKAGAMGTAFTVREVYRNKWQHLATPEAARRACEVLSDFNWIRPVERDFREFGGRPSESFQVNPLAIEGVV